MFKIFRYVLWLVVVLALMLSFDQLMISFPLTTPGLAHTQKFYVSFRQRLGNLVNGVAEQPLSALKKADKVSAPTKKNSSPDTIAKVISKSAATKVKQEAQRFLYVDAQGDLQFADSIEQIPKRFRESAQPLAK